MKSIGRTDVMEDTIHGIVIFALFKDSLFVDTAEDDVVDAGLADLPVFSSHRLLVFI